MMGNGMMGGMMGNGTMSNGTMGVGTIVGLVISLALLTLLVLGIVWMLRQLQSSPAAGRLPVSARGAVWELELRYARGEIDRDTYLAMRDDLDRR